MALVYGSDYDHIDLHAAAGGDVTRHMLKDAQARSDVGELKSALDAIRMEGVGKNLVDPSKFVTGAVGSDGSIDSSSYSAYSTSDFIEIEQNTTYTFTIFDKTTNAVKTQRKIYLLYDSDKEPITASYQNINNETSVSISSGTAAYIRVSAPTVYNFQLEKGSSSTYYSPFTIYRELTIMLGETPMAQVSAIVDDMNEDIIYSVNMVDPTKLTTGIIESNGAINSESGYAAYSTSDYIKLEQNTTYTFAIFDKTTHERKTQRKYVLLFDAAKTSVTESYQNVNNAETVTISSGSYAYARISAPTLYDMQLEKGSIESPQYVEYSVTMNTKLGGDAITQVKAIAADELNGKKWAVCGDSFTYGATSTKIISGQYAGKNYVYPYLIGNRTGIDVLQFFSGGRTLAFPAEPGDFTNSLTNSNADFYYQNIPADVDYITIYLGINDHHHLTGGGDGEDPTGVINLGTIDDNTVATYYGAWNVVLTWLITNRPNAHIGIIVTNGITTTPETDAAHPTWAQALWHKAQIDIAEKYGIPYIDLNGDSRTPAMLRTSNTNIPDSIKTALIEKWRVSSTNLHPNDDAQLFESWFIETFLRTI